MAGKRPKGRTCPSFALEEAIGFVGKVKAAIGIGAADADVVAKAIGHAKRSSGNAATKIGTMSHFGLLSRAGTGKYKVSGTALRILLPTSEEEKAKAICGAAVSPSLYVDLIERYKGHELPGMLANILSRDFGVLERKAEGVVDVFKRSMEYAGLLEEGVLCPEDKSYRRDAYDETDNLPVVNEDAGGNRSAFPFAEGSQGGTGNAPRRGRETIGVQEYQILLAGRRTAYLVMPEGFSMEDLDQVNKWLEFNKMVLISEKTADPRASGEISQGEQEATQREAEQSSDLER